MLNPGPVALVTASWRATANVAPIAWTTPLSMSPALLGCVIHPARHTSAMIRFSEEFALNIPGPGLLKQTAFLGSQSGFENDKIAAAKLDTFAAQRIDVPLIDGCLAWIECGLQDVVPIGDHTLFVGRVLRVQALDEAYAQYWLLEQRAFSPLVYLGGTRYSVLGETLDAQFEVDAQGGLVVETAEEREAREEAAAIALEQQEREGE